MTSRKIICLVSGKSYTFSKDYYDKRVVEYGDEDSLKKYFITRRVKTYLNKGYSINDIRNILNVTDETLPGQDSEEVRAYHVVCLFRARRNIPGVDPDTGDHPHGRGATLGLRDRRHVRVAHRDVGPARAPLCQVASESTSHIQRTLPGFDRPLDEVALHAVVKFAHILHDCTCLFIYNVQNS